MWGRRWVERMLLKRKVVRLEEVRRWVKLVRLGDLWKGRWCGVVWIK